MRIVSLFWAPQLIFNASQTTIAKRRVMNGEGQVEKHNYNELQHDPIMLLMALDWRELSSLTLLGLS